MFVPLKKRRVLWSVLFMVGLVFFSSDAWSMKRDNRVHVTESRASEEILSTFPDELFINIFSFCTPIDFIHAGQVSEAWRRTGDKALLNDPQWWQRLTGKMLLAPNSETFKCSVAAAQTLFNMTSTLKRHFVIDFTKIKVPSPLSPKYLFMSTYCERSSRRLIGVSSRDILKIANLQLEAKKWKDLAWEGGYPMSIPSLENADAIPPMLLNGSILTVALYGSSKQQQTAMELIVGNFKNPNQKQVEALINLGQAWPGGRRTLLAQAYGLGDLFGVTLKDNLGRAEPFLETIGHGKLAEGFFGESVTLEWPEAFHLLGDSYRSLAFRLPPNERGELKIKAKEYYSRAIQGGDEKASKSLAQFLEPVPGNELCLREMMKIDPHSGTVLCKICRILADKIPGNAGFEDPYTNEFMDFFKLAYDRLSGKQRGLPAGIMSTPRRGENRVIDLNKKIKTPEDLIDVLAEYLKRKRYLGLLKTEVRFLDCVMSKPNYAYGNNWVEETISRYFQDKWGNTFSRTGKRGATAESWLPIDTKFGFEYFGRSNNKIAERNFYQLVMGIFLKNKEEQNFVKAFKAFHLSVSAEEVGKGNYNFLETKKGQFRKAFPKATVMSAELDGLFDILPAPMLKEKPPTQKNPLSGKNNKENEEL
jgi:hypothetical protein